jgi:hypothetical protein
MNNLIFLCFLLLSLLNAWADDAPKQEPACRRENGRISCSEAGFKTMTDALIDYRAGEEKWSLRHTACVMTREAAETSLVACEAGRTLAEERLAAIKQPGPLRPVLAVTGAVLGAVALSAAFVVTDLPPQVRLGLGAGGMVGLAAGYIFVLPEKLEK